MRTRAGSLLVVTLWLVTILSVLSVAIGRYLSLGVKMTRYRVAREQTRTLARSGVYLAMQRLAEDVNESDGAAYDWAGDSWAGEWRIDVPSGALTLRMADEERKLNLNTATADQLRSVVADDLVVQGILDARDEPDPAEEQPGAQPPYAPKNGPFVVPEELADLPGMTREAYAALDAATSPYYGVSTTVNINTAPPEVLRAFGLSETTVQMVERFREGPDGPGEHQEDGVFRQSGPAIVQLLKDTQGVDLTGTPDGNLLGGTDFGVASQTFTVTVESALERPMVRTRIDAIVRRTPCPDGTPAPCIIAWREG
jgi:type II secretory pathway component PulK